MCKAAILINTVFCLKHFFPNYAIILSQNGNDKTWLKHTKTANIV